MNMELWGSTVIPSQYRHQRMVTFLKMCVILFIIAHHYSSRCSELCNGLLISVSNHISWTPPLRPNGVIIAYEVSYRPTDSSDPETRLNTTDLETSLTTQSDLEEGTEFIFSVRAYTRVGPGNASSITVSTLSEESKTLPNTIL